MALEPFLILSTQGGLRADDGSPVALGYHTGHWEVGLLVKEAAEELKRLGTVPFAGAVSDPCDGRTQGTTGMMDSLPYRNDAAIVFRRLIRSLPRAQRRDRHRDVRQGLARDDDGAGRRARFAERPGPRRRDASADRWRRRWQNSEHRRALCARLSDAWDSGRTRAVAACATAGGGCQFLGTAATAQVVAEGLGMAPPHSALAPSGQPVWRDIATRAARYVAMLASKKLATRDILTDAAIRNAMTVHAAFGGSDKPVTAHPRDCIRGRIEAADGG